MTPTETDTLNLISLPAEDWMDEAIGTDEPAPARFEIAGSPADPGAERDPESERGTDFRLVVSASAEVARVTPVTALWLDGKLLFCAVPEVVGAEDPYVFGARIAGTSPQTEQVTIAGVAERIAEGDPVERFLAAHEEKYGYRPELEEADAAVFALLPG